MDSGNAKFCVVNPAQHNTSSAISRTNNSVTQHIIVFTVDASGTYCTDLVDDDVIGNSSGGEQFGFVIESDSSVTVYLHHDNWTATPIIPANLLGTEYVIIGRADRNNYVIISALEDDTVILIRCDTSRHNASEKMILDENQSITREFSSVARINANAKVNVISYELGGGGFVSSVPSVSRYGMQYIIPAFTNISITVTSIYKDTAVKIEESTESTIVVLDDIGEQYEFKTSASICALTGVQPFVVTMEYLDTEMHNRLLVPPSEQAVSSALFLQSIDTFPAPAKVALLRWTEDGGDLFEQDDDWSEMEFFITEWSDNKTFNSILLEFTGDSSSMLKFLYFDDFHYIPLPGGLDALREVRQ